MEHFVIDIAWGTIIRVGIAVLAVFAIFYFRELLWILWAGIVIATLTNVPVDFLQKYRVPRPVGTFFIYGLLIVLFVFLVAIFVPSVVEEARQLANVLPQPIQDILTHAPLAVFERQAVLFDKLLLGQDLPQVFSGFVRMSIQLFGVLSALAFIIAIAIFLSLDRMFLDRFLETVAPQRLKEHSLLIWRRGQQRIAGWFGLRLLGALFVGVTTLVGLLLLGAPYPFTLGVAAGLFDLVPFVGPVVIGIVMIGFASVESVSLAVAVGIMFTLIQQVGEYIIRPLASKKLIGMHPIYVLIFVAIGFKLGGILGTILILPLGALVFEILREIHIIRTSYESESSS